MTESVQTWLQKMVANEYDPTRAELGILKIAPEHWDTVRSWVAMLGCYRSGYHRADYDVWYHPDSEKNRGWVLLDPHPNSPQDCIMLLYTNALPAYRRVPEELVQD